MNGTAGGVLGLLIAVGIGLVVEMVVIIHHLSKNKWRF